MQLYDAGRAVNPRRVRIFLAEKGISVPLVPVDIAKLEHKTAEYTAMNPSGRTPVLLLDDGTAISESVAICRYFEELQPDPPLFGTGARERALVEMWQRRIEFELLSAVASVFRHTHPFMAPMEVPQVPEWGEANRDKVPAFLRILEAHLEGHRFVCGDNFTVADITGLAAVDFMRLPKIPLPDGIPSVRRWHAEISARPSASA